MLENKVIEFQIKNWYFYLLQIRLLNRGIIWGLNVYNNNNRFIFHFSSGIRDLKTPHKIKKRHLLGGK
jgi:hypothetical protein